MAWLLAITQLLGTIAWPLTVMILVVMLRKEIRDLIRSVKEVKYPGGSITLKEEIKQLETTLEESTATVKTLPTQAVQQIPTSSRADSQLSIAHMRLEVEKELFQLSQIALREPAITGWHVGRQIDELEKANILTAQLTDAIRTFIDLSNRIIHAPDTPDEVALRAASIGSSLVAELRHKRLVRRMVDDFDGHGLWHMYRHVDESSRKYYFWSAVAASLLEFDYDYGVYREAIEQHNQRMQTYEANGRQSLYVLSLEEFVKVLEFREKELLRLIDVWHSHGGWRDFEKANEWRWPKDWGNLGWSSPIIRDRLSLFTAQQDLMQTRAALDRYRSLLLAAPRA